MVRLIIFMMNHDSIEGPVNATAPEPVTYNQFTRSFAKALSRPHWLPMPTWALTLLFGESAQLLTEGQRVVPKMLLDAGFDFQINDVDTALKSIVNQ
jgi:NAD dependent epimerase/dehydratase family enzyme